MGANIVSIKTMKSIILVKTEKRSQTLYICGATTATSAKHDGNYIQGLHVYDMYF